MAITKEQQAELTYTPEYIVNFVRKVQGDEAADRVANSFESLAYWDAKIEDWTTD